MINGLEVKNENGNNKENKSLYLGILSEAELANNKFHDLNNTELIISGLNQLGFKHNTSREIRNSCISRKDFCQLEEEIAYVSFNGDIPRGKGGICSDESEKFREGKVRIISLSRTNSIDVDIAPELYLDIKSKSCPNDLPEEGHSWIQINTRQAQKDLFSRRDLKKFEKVYIELEE